MAKVVVCEDDPLVRSSISALCDEAGLEVVAETDSGGAAVELVRRFGVDVLVLDLSLSDGSGERTLEGVAANGTHTDIVVFTAYAADAAHLVRLGALDVVEKPHFERLGEVLARIGASASLPSGERRIASRPVNGSPPRWRSPSGVSSHLDLRLALQELEAGDSVLAVTVVGLEDVPDEVGSVLLADCRLAVARELRQQLRVQDLLYEAPEIDGFLALVRGGDARAAGAVWSRLVGALRDSSLPGEVRGAATRVDASGAADAVTRAIAELRAASLATASFVSV